MDPWRITIDQRAKAIIIRGAGCPVGQGRGVQQRIRVGAVVIDVTHVPEHVTDDDSVAGHVVLIDEIDHRTDLVIHIHGGVVFQPDQLGADKQHQQPQRQYPKAAQQAVDGRGLANRSFLCASTTTLFTCTAETLPSL